MTGLAVRQKISSCNAEKMIWDLIYHGNHSRRDAMKNAPKNSIKNWFDENKESFSDVVSRCRNYFNEAVPFVENIIGSTFMIDSKSGGGVSVSLIKSGKTQPELTVDGPGTIGVDYWAKFEAACHARDRAIKKASLDEFHGALTKGIASIESYMAHRVEVWNRTDGKASPLIDSKENKIPFEEKIKNWIPKMTGGKKLDISGRMWADFLELKKIRDSEEVHSKQFSQGTAYEDLAKKLNKFGSGLADFLLQLHILFDEPVPSVVIRAKYHPEIFLESYN